MKKISLAVILFITCISCKKNESEKPVPIPVKEIFLHPDATSYLHFKPGSYWVYKDSVSQAIDSVYIIQYNTGFEEYKIKDTLNKFEFVGYVLYHSFDNQTTYFNLQAVFHSTLEHRWRGYYAQPFIAPLGSGAIRDPNGRLINMPNEKRVSVNGFSFSNGVEMEWITYDNVRLKPSNDLYWYNKLTKTKFTFARNAGVIKQVLKNDTLHQVWELIAYKAVQ